MVFDLSIPDLCVLPYSETLQQTTKSDDFCFDLHFNPIYQRDAFKRFCKQSRTRLGSSNKSCLIRVYSVFLGKYNLSDPTLVDLASNFFVLCTNMKVYLYNHS